MFVTATAQLAIIFIFNQKMFTRIDELFKMAKRVLAFVSSDLKRVSFSQIAPFDSPFGRTNFDCYCLRTTRTILSAFAFVRALSTFRNDRAHRDDKKYTSRVNTISSNVCLFNIPFQLRCNDKEIPSSLCNVWSCPSFLLTVESFSIIFLYVSR